MRKKVFNPDISHLFEKLFRQWKMLENEGQISRIDIDILKSDIRNLYESMIELERNFESGNEIVIGKSVQSKPVDQKNIELEIEVPKQNNKQQNVKTPTVQGKDTREVITKNKKKKVVTSTGDLFSDFKTVADKYEDKKDNSLAAKMQNDCVSDIRTVIGINDKFLFINEIFKGETTAYNKAIDKLNTLSNYHEALDFIEEFKISAQTNENKDIFKKLIGIVRRRYL